VRLVRRGDHCCVNLCVWRNLSGELPGNVVWGDLRARGLGLLRSGMRGEGFGDWGCLGQG
jgi:hypothetical protein